MNQIEHEAIELVDTTLKEMPIKKLRSMELHWECVGSEFLPVLNCEFYEEEEK